MPDSPVRLATAPHVGERSGSETNSSGVAWSAVFGGAFASMALSVLLVTLGSGLDLAALSPSQQSKAAVTAMTAGTAIWLVVTHWFASGLGGYLTGRLRTKWAGLHTHEVFFRDTANGFLSWAVAAVFGAAVTAATAVFLLSATASIGASATAGAGQASVPSDEATRGPSAYLLDRLFRSDQPATTDSDAQVKALAGEIVVNGLRDGDVPTADRTYLAQLVAARTGVTQDEAGKRVDALIDDTKAAKAKAQAAIDAARKAAATLSIFTALAMLIGAFVASAAAALGGQQRDEY